MSSDRRERERATMRVAHNMKLHLIVSLCCTFFVCLFCLATFFFRFFSLSLVLFYLLISLSDFLFVVFLFCPALSFSPISKEEKRECARLKVSKIVTFPYGDHAFAYTLISFSVNETQLKGRKTTER